MSSLQHWLHGWVPRWAWKRGTHQVQITPACRKTFSPWTDPSFLRAGVPLEQISRHAVVLMDASATCWGATYNGHAVSGVNGRVPTALAYQLPRVAGSTPCLELPQRAPSGARTFWSVQTILRPLRISTRKAVYAPVACSNSPTTSSSGVRSNLRSLRAIHIPGVFNRAADELSRVALPGERRLYPQVVQLIWGRFGVAQVDLFASPETTHCQWFYSLTEATLGTDALAHSWPWGLRKYAPPPVSLQAQTQGGRGAGLVSGSILAKQDLVSGTHAPRDSPFLADSFEEGSAFSETGHPLAPASRPVETPCVVSGRDVEVLGDLPQEVALTIASARAPSTRLAYALKWNLFHRMVFLSPWGPPEMFDQSRAFFFATRVGA